jgi:hypothetical protein
MAAPGEYHLDAMVTSLEAGFVLDELYSWMEGRMESSKRPALARLARLLAEAGTPYALIGGVAVQAHRSEPRTTLDIDVLVRDRADWPAAILEREGFRRTGSFEHSENWESAEGTPVRITSDPELAEGIERAVTIEIDGVPLRLLAPLDLVRAKLRAASDPARRRSKRLLDLADAQGLIEDHPELGRELTLEEAAQLSGGNV